MCPGDDSEHTSGGNRVKHAVRVPGYGFRRRGGMDAGIKQGGGAVDVVD